MHFRCEPIQLTCELGVSFVSSYKSRSIKQKDQLRRVALIADVGTSRPCPSSHLQLLITFISKIIADATLSVTRL